MEQQIAVKETEQKAKLVEYDLKVQSEFDARERAEREREAARGDAAAEKSRLASLLKVGILSFFYVFFFSSSRFPPFCEVS